MNENSDSMKSVIRRLVAKIATEIDPDVEVHIIRIGSDNQPEDTGSSKE
jgi:hypothetical protein